MLDFKDAAKKLEFDAVMEGKLVDGFHRGRGDMVKMMRNKNDFSSEILYGLERYNMGLWKM